MSDITQANLGLVQNAAVTNTAMGQEADMALGSNNQQLVSEIHGKWYEAAVRGCLFAFNRTAVSVPVITSAVVSVFSLYNPTGSGKVLELIDWDMGQLSATTVIDAIGLYWSGGPAAAAGTFSTQAVFGTDYFGGVPGKSGGVGIPYRAYTHSGTPVRIAILTSQNTTSVVDATPVRQDFDGKIVLAPGDVVSICASTAAMTSSVTDLSIRWAEWQLPA